jgi:hypothetical protein
MWNADPQTFVILLSLVQAAGIVSAAFARWGAESRAPGFYYGIFYGLLALAGVANVMSLAVSATFWFLNNSVVCRGARRCHSATLHFAQDVG